MNFKPAKSRSLVLKKGNVMEKVLFKIAGATIRTLNEKPIKTFNSSLKDTAANQQAIKYLEE